MTLLVCGGLLAGIGTGAAQGTADGEGGLVTPPAPINSAPSRIQMTPVTTNVAAKPTVGVNTAQPTPTNQRPAVAPAPVMKPVTNASSAPAPTVSVTPTNNNVAAVLGLPPRRLLHRP